MQHIVLMYNFPTNRSKIDIRSGLLKLRTHNIISYRKVQQIKHEGTIQKIKNNKNKATKERLKGAKISQETPQICQLQHQGQFLQVKQAHKHNSFHKHIGTTKLLKKEEKKKTSLGRLREITTSGHCQDSHGALHR